MNPLQLTTIECHDELNLFLSLNKTQRKQSMKYVTCITLNACNVGDHALNSISETLSPKSPLSCLRLDYVSISRRAFKALLNKIESTLRSLVIFSASGVDLCCIRRFGFGRNQIKELSLNNCNLGLLGGKAVIQYTRTNSTLSTLSVGGNKLSDEFANDLARVVGSNLHLDDINLEWNIITGCGAIDVVTAAANHHPSMRTINLKFNAITDDEAQECIRKCYQGCNYNFSCLLISASTTEAAYDGDDEPIEPQDYWHLPELNFSDDHDEIYEREYNKSDGREYTQQYLQSLPQAPGRYDPIQHLVHWIETSHRTYNDLVELFCRKESFLRAVYDDINAAIVIDCKKSHIPLLLHQIPERIPGLRYEVLRTNISNMLRE